MRNKKKEYIPNRDVRSESWLVSQRSRVSGSNFEDLTKFTSICTLFSCSHSLAAENLSHTVKHTHTHSLENRPHHKGWAASMPQGHKTEEMKTKTIRRKRERGMSTEETVF